MDCCARPFVSKADMLRHRREVHGKNENGLLDSYPCPVAACKRSERGFRRQWNMLEHVKRLHPTITSPGSATTSHIGDLDYMASPVLSSARSSVSRPLSSLEEPDILCHGLRQKMAALEAERRDTLCRYDEKIKALSEAIRAIQKPG